jgi:hypothetical protein
LNDFGCPAEAASAFVTFVEALVKAAMIVFDEGFDLAFKSPARK